MAWVKDFCHWYRGHGLNFQLLALDSPHPNLCGHLRSEPEDGIFSFYYFLFLSISIFVSQMNLKSIWDDVFNVYVSVHTHRCVYVCNGLEHPWILLWNRNPAAFPTSPKGSLETMSFLIKVNTKEKKKTYKYTMCIYVCGV